jgi:hypothetical protein
MMLLIGLAAVALFRNDQAVGEREQSVGSRQSIEVSDMMLFNHVVADLSAFIRVHLRTNPAWLFRWLRVTRVIACPA